MPRKNRQVVIPVFLELKRACGDSIYYHIDRVLRTPQLRRQIIEQLAPEVESQSTLLGILKGEIPFDPEKTKR